ncbi:FabD/lysophospholipase-like protein [Myriangium duriaei CBS 260.36]|uniref:FabD/lysophospholipase-like protein n=1 Tax=Myriangium duriaei CBS 260.36 TaxID=1168546 RepID=A0A9P4IWF0_9PEZI|nr:FabD/lysophospholipase-like protein [Myriangium duriaei CBS 260.36]
MDESGRLHRKDTTKGPPLRILSLDGGGVRGYSMLIILQELMHRTFVETEGRAPKRHEIPRPCDHFDLIVGTGTGGLIAIMLGRLRLDIDTCKDVYVRMTRKVFETDKTFAGIPYRGTLFKASKLEEAIKECVSQHTIDGGEGNDSIAIAQPMSPDTPGTRASFSTGLQRSPSVSSRYSQVGMSPLSPRMGRWGNPNSLLYDLRENRTKTAVTAVYKGTPKGGSAALLRSYDSRKESAPEFECSIWQAGRATSATGLAFKPIKIGQSVFIDEGAGKYNPSPLVLDEAVLNEWPGRDVGVFVSIGTGKRPGGTSNQQHLWWEGFVGGAIGDFAEARRRLISKIEGCEETHQYMVAEHLAKRGVSIENYFRLNVEVGVGEFAMNEWNRLSDISSNTRMYLARPDVTSMNMQAAAKLARVHFAKKRHDRPYSASSIQDGPEQWDRPASNYVPPPLDPTAAELPAEDVVPGVDTIIGPRQYVHRTASLANAKYSIFPDESYSRPMDSPLMGHHMSNRNSRSTADSARRSNSSVNVASPQQSHESHNWGQPPPPPAYGAQGSPKHSPPPIPPKTPLPYPNSEHTPRSYSNGNDTRRHPAFRDDQNGLPYPDTDAPPPAVNMARKPEFGVR